MALGDRYIALKIYMDVGTYTGWSCVRKFQNKSLVTSVSSKYRMSSECIFVFFPGVADRNALNSDYSLQMAIVIC